MQKNILLVLLYFYCYFKATSRGLVAGIVFTSFSTNYLDFHLHFGVV